LRLKGEEKKKLTNEKMKMEAVEAVEPRN